MMNDDSVAPAAEADEAKKREEPRPVRPRSVTVIGWILIVVYFIGGGFVGWATLTLLDGPIPADGSVPVWQLIASLLGHLVVLAVAAGLLLGLEWARKSFLIGVPVLIVAGAFSGGEVGLILTLLRGVLYLVCLVYLTKQPAVAYFRTKPCAPWISPLLAIVAVSGIGGVGALIPFHEKVDSYCVDLIVNKRMDDSIKLAEQGELMRALETIKGAIRIRPENSELHVNCGVLLAQLGRLEEAEAHLQKSLQLNPQCVNAYFNCGVIEIRRGGIDNAIECFRRCTKLDPKNSAAFYNLAVALNRRNRTEEALEKLESAIVLKPDDWSYHEFLGSIEAQRGEYEKAERALRRAIELNPESTRASEMLERLEKMRSEEPTGE